MRYLEEKEHTLADIHSQVLTLLKALVDMSATRQQELSSMEPHALFVFCGHVEEIFHRLNQVIFGLEPSFHKVEWPFKGAAGLAEPPPEVEQAQHVPGRPISCSSRNLFAQKNKQQSNSFPMRRTQSLQHGAKFHSAIDKKAKFSRWSFEVIDRVALALKDVEKLVNRFQEVLKRVRDPNEVVSRQDQSEAGREKWESIRTEAPSLPSNTAVRKATMFVREADCKAVCHLLDVLTSVTALINGSLSVPACDGRDAMLHNKGKLRTVRSRKLLHQLLAVLPSEFDCMSECGDLLGDPSKHAMLLCMLKKRVHPRVYFDGQYIIRAGTVGMSMFFIQTGKVEIRAPGGQLLATLQAGNFVGECALLSSATRIAHVRAVGCVELMELTRQELAELMTWYPVLLTSLVSSSRQRMQLMNPEQQVPEMGPQTAVAAVAGELRAKLRLGSSSENLSALDDDEAGAGGLATLRERSNEDLGCMEPFGMERAESGLGELKKSAGDWSMFRDSFRSDEADDEHEYRGAPVEESADCLKNFKALCLAPVLISSSPLEPSNKPKRIFASESFSRSFSWSFPRLGSSTREMRAEGGESLRVPSSPQTRKKMDQEEVWVELVKGMREKSLDQGEVLVQAGATGSPLVCVQSGLLVLLDRTGLEVMRLEPGGLLGPVELMVTGVSLVTAKALLPTVVLELETQDLVPALCRSEVLYPNLQALAYKRYEDWERRGV